MKISKLHPGLQLLLYSLLAGLLLAFSWYPYGHALLIFIAWIPLLVLSDKLIKIKERFYFWNAFIYSFPAFWVWNGITTWWIWYSTSVGSIAAIALNALLMSFLFSFWHQFRKIKKTAWIDYIALISFWCCFEYLHLNWQLAWPWLNLGNVFAPQPGWIQWYEYTGTFGGTIWIFGANILLYELGKNLISYFKSRKEVTESQPAKRCAILLGIATATMVILPPFFSKVIQKKYQIPKEQGIEAVIVQQNTDPWHEQYRMNNREHVQRLIQVASSQLTPNTQLLICSESAIPNNLPLAYLVDNNFPKNGYDYYAFQLLDSLISQYPKLNLIAGLSTAEFYDHAATPTARHLEDHYYYDLFNTSVCYNRGGTAGTYHKSRLVPGVEKMPYPKLFGILEYFVIDLGGSTGSLGVDSVQRAFPLAGTDPLIQIGAPICYESVYGELFGKFVLNGAQIMSVITNDAWWSTSPGHRQHFELSKLRAIESRKYVLRSANTGISAFIDPLGKSSQETTYGTRTAIRETVYPNNEITFYVKHGDYLARFALAVSAVLVLFQIILTIRNRVSRKKRLVR